jgi:hypothetical protein
MIRSSLVCEPLKWLLIQQKLISATDERHFTPKNKANSLLLVAAQGRTTQKIKKELSICQSLFCLDLVSFPVLSQIKPQAPRLVAIVPVDYNWISIISKQIQCKCKCRLPLDLWPKKRVRT